MRDELGRILLDLARHAIAGQLGEAEAPVIATEAAELERPGACFVTLTLGGQLRGCIGSLAAWRSLREDVRANACAAAFRDPRFAPLSGEEFAQVRIEVSLLTPPQPLSFSDEADALAQLRPGIDGVVLEHGKHRSTFLPQVWAELPDPGQFLGQLKIKAGLPRGFWSEELKLSRYQVEKWKEENPS